LRIDGEQKFAIVALNRTVIPAGDADVGPTPRTGESRFSGTGASCGRQNLAETRSNAPQPELASQEPPQQPDIGEVRKGRALRNLQIAVAGAEDADRHARLGSVKEQFRDPWLGADLEPLVQ